MAGDDACLLAIDLGTSAIKLALVSTQGRLLAHEVEPLDVIFLPGGGAEQDPEAWWKALVRGTRRLVERSGISSSRIIGLGSSVQWSGTVAVDRDGRALHHAVIWMDSRGAEAIEKITRGFPSVEGYAASKLYSWIRKTGGAPGKSGKDPIAHILFLRDQFPELHQKTYKYLEPKDWLNFRLTGRCVASFDSIALHWVTDNRNIEAVDYDAGLLKQSGLEREKLPDLVPAATVLGPLSAVAAREPGLSESVQVASGMADVFAGAIGSGAVRDYEAHLCLGTSSWLVCHVPYKKTDLFHNMASLPSAIPGRYLLTNTQESAGVCLSLLKEKLLLEDDYAAMIARAESIPAGSDGLIFLPWLNGERSPVDDRIARGGFSNLNLESTRGHLVRAVLEGVAFNARWLLGYVESFIGKKLEAIRVIGGGARSNLWCQILADVLERPIQQVEDSTHAGARGAALQASVALGHLKWEDVPRCVRIAQTFEPNAKHRSIYTARFAEFHDLYKAQHRIRARHSSKE